MTIEEIEALVQGYLAPNDVDGAVAKKDWGAR